MRQKILKKFKPPPLSVCAIAKKKTTNTMQLRSVPRVLKPRSPPKQRNPPPPPTCVCNRPLFSLLIQRRLRAARERMFGPPLFSAAPREGSLVERRLHVLDAPPWGPSCAASSDAAPHAPHPTLSDAARELQLRKQAQYAQLAHDAETAVDAFLAAQYGFDGAAVPHDYLDTPPSDLSAVQTCFDTLAHCTADVFHPSSAVNTVLVRPFVGDAWRTRLLPLRAELSQLLERLGAESGGNAAAAAAAVRKDVAHLDAMWAMDGPVCCDGAAPLVGAEACGGKLSDVVPVYGLLVGRLHRLENEHRTVLQHWSGRRRAQ